MTVRRPSPALAVAFLALAVALGGVAVAAVPAKNGDVHMCYSKATGNAKVVDSQTSRFKCERNWRGFTIAAQPQRLESPESDATLRVATNGDAVMNAPGGEIRIGDKKVNVTASDELQLSTGGASILMKKDGTIAITGSRVTIDGTEVDIKAASDVTVKGTKIGQN